MSPLLSVTREQLIDRRDAILARLGVTLDEYMRRVDAAELSGPEWEARDDLDSIAFLLKEDRSID